MSEVTPAMTRAELLQRLQDIARDGGDMSLPVAVRTSRRTPDKRTRDGYRIVETWSAVRFGMQGAVRIDGVDYGEFLAKPLAVS